MYKPSLKNSCKSTKSQHKSQKYFIIMPFFNKSHCKFFTFIPMKDFFLLFKRKCNASFSKNLSQKDKLCIGANEKS